MSVLVLTLPASPEAEVAAWALVQDGEVCAEGQVRPGEAAALPPDRRPDRAVALMPSQAVFVRRLSAPGASERDARRAAPFLIEDQIAQLLEEIVVETGPKGADGARFVLAMDAGLRESWRRFAAGLGVKPLHAVPDAMVITGHGADLTAMKLGDRVLIQTRAGDLAAGEADAGAARDTDAMLAEPVAAAIEADLADTVLPALAARLNPRRVIVCGGLEPNLAAPDGTPIAFKRLPAPDLRLAAASVPVEAFAVLPPALGAGLISGLDWSAQLAPWRAAAILAVTACLGLAALSAGQAAYLERRADAYAQARIEAFQAAFPEVRVVDVDVQLRRRLAAVGAADSQSGGFLDLSAALAGLLSEVDAVRVNAMRYDAERGGLTVSAVYSDFGDFEALRAAAAARDVVLEDGGARQSASGVEGEFTVRLP